MRKNGAVMTLGLMICICIVFTFYLIQTPSKHRSSNASFDEYALVDAVKMRAKQVYMTPVEPRIDRVWKLIPGLNGKMLDEQKTIKASSQSWRESKSITEVYRTLNPLQSLRAMPAAPIYRANPQKQAVAFMVNVAWGNEHIPQMLQTFRVKQAKATFFLDGSWLSKNVELAMQIKRAGHELSNHGYSHKNMSQLSTKQAYDEIAKTELLLKKIGIKNQLFAPPSGDFDDDTVTIAREIGLFTILWTVDTVDWKRPAAQQIIAKIRDELTAGSLVLMHPTANTAKALPYLIDEAHKRGYTVETVSNTISSERMMFVE